MEIHDGWNVSHLVMHSAFDELGKASEIANVELSVGDIDYMQCFFAAIEIEQRRATSRKHLVTAVALFQAGMESLINYWRSKYPDIEGGSNFVAYWKNAFTIKGVQGSFDDYAYFYRNIRNAIIHPDSVERIETINNLEFIQVYEGIKHGWVASEKLSQVLGTPYDNNSWEIMCSAHSVPTLPSIKDYPNLGSLRHELNRKHLKELNRR